MGAKMRRKTAARDFGVRVQAIILCSCLTSGLLAQSPAKPSLDERRASALLEQKMRELDQPPAKPAQPQGPALEQLERDYAADKITARQFQWYLQRYKFQYVKAANHPVKPAAQPAVAPQKTGGPISASPVRQTERAVPSPSPSATVIPSAAPVPTTPAVTSAKLPDPPPGPALTTNKPAGTNAAPAGPEDDDPAFLQVENKIDELLRLKEAREQAAQLNSLLATNTPAGLKSKRQRLNELIRLHVNGKLTEQEYKAKRDAIVAEPED